MANEDRLQALRLKFVARAREQAVRAAELRGELAARGMLAAEPLRELNRLCHSLHGAAGTFGFVAISDAADEAEDLTDRMEGSADTAPGATPGTTLAAKLDEALGRMLALIAALA